MSQHYFAQVSPGLEAVLRAELKTLGARKLKLDEGGVHFQGTRKHLYRALLKSRIASRVYWTLIDATAPQTEALFARVIKFNWTSLVTADEAPLKLSIRVSMTSASAWSGSGEVESIIFNGIERALADHRRVISHPWSSDAGETRGVLRLLVRLHQGRVTIRVDAAGDLMHRRGWRAEEGHAPLRPTLASAMLNLLEWTPEESLYDPMCGSGTFAVEGSRWASAQSPRLWSGYACQDWASFDAALWEDEARVDQHQLAESSTLWRIFASDRDPRAVALTQRHLATAGVSAQVWVSDVHEGDFKPPSDQPGLLVFNPPYGLRVVDGGELKAALSRFASDTERWGGWRVGFIYPRQLTPPKVKGLRYDELARFQHGGLPVWVWRCVHDDTEEM